MRLDKCLKESCDRRVRDIATGANVIALSEPAEATGETMSCSLSLDSKSNRLRVPAGFIFISFIQVFEATCPEHEFFDFKLQPNSN